MPYEAILLFLVLLLAFAIFMDRRSRKNRPPPQT